MSLLEVRGLSVDIAGHAGVAQVVRDVSFSLEPGQALGIVGESGSGKSMTALALMRLLPADATSRATQMSFDGRSLPDLSRETFARELQGPGFGMIFQEPMTSLNPVYKIGRQLTEATLMRGFAGPRQARHRAIELLERVGIPQPEVRFEQYPHQLSGGQRQRVMIAMALMMNPKVLIADEPTTALDVSIQAQILALIDDLRRDLGMAVILISHDIAVVSQTTDKVMVMYGGEVLEQGPSSALLAHPAHPYTAALLNAVPQIEGPRTLLATIPGTTPNLTALPKGCIFQARCPYVQAVCRNAPIALFEVKRQQARCLRLEQVVKDNTVRPPLPMSPATETQASICLSAKHITQSYRAAGKLFQKKVEVQALRDVSLDVMSGEILALVGESGSGKSTLARIMLGLEQPKHGEVWLNGQPIGTLSGPDRAKVIQPVFQDPYSSLNPRRTVFEIISRPLALRGVSLADQKQRVMQQLDLVRLPQGIVHHYPQQLSGGQRQRIAIARAMITEPKILVCDEPTSALDVSVQAQILNLLAELRAAFGLTALLITHDMAVVHQLADRVAVLLQGELVELGQTDQVLQSPVSDYTRRLVAAAPRFEVQKSMERSPV
jgi:peptide/nickel transport system ATP-binding protein